MLARQKLDYNALEQTQNLHKNIHIATNVANGLIPSGGCHSDNIVLACAKNQLTTFKR